MTWPTESAGRWLEPCGNAGPRGMTVIARKGRNRIPLIGLLHSYSGVLSRNGDETVIFAGM